jgi:hypothetical protein
MSESPRHALTPEEAASILFDDTAAQITALVAELFTAQAARDRRGLEPLDFLDGAAALIGSAWKMAQLAGEEHRAAYAEILRRHADAVESVGLGECG